MCEENTYGYNAVTGCQECSCRTEGTNGDMSCRFESNKNNSKSFIVVQKLHISPLSLDSGQCNCADRVEGRQCDHCVWGAWNYPTCDPCDCDTKGTTEKICDQVKLKNTGFEICATVKFSGNIRMSLQAQRGARPV